MPKIIVVSDLHIDAGTLGTTQGSGLNSAWQVAHRMWLFSVHKAIELGADAIVVNGDIFDTGHPWPEAIRLFRQGLEIAEMAGLPVILVGGNHELSPREPGHKHLLEQFEGLDRVHVVHSLPTVIRLANCQIVAVPWPDIRYISNHMQAKHDISRQLQLQCEWLYENLGAIASRLKDESLLVGHLMMDKSQFYNKLIEQAATIKYPGLPLDVLDGPWVASVLGHVHMRQNLTPRIEYAGCPWTITKEDAQGYPRGPSLIQWGDGGYTSTMIPGPDRVLLHMEVRQESDLERLREKTSEYDDTSVVLIDLFDPLLVDQTRSALPVGPRCSVRVQASKTEITKTGESIEHYEDPTQAIREWAGQENISEKDLLGMLREAETLLRAS